MVMWGDWNLISIK